MNAFKDFLYNKNDVLIALVILVLAALLIVWRLDVIMEYPQTLAKETGTVDTTEKTATPSKENKKPSTAAGTTTLWEGGKLTKDVTVPVQSGSATIAVQSLVDAKLFKSYDEFVTVCQAVGYTPENIKATTFVFEEGCTQTDIAKRVTQ